MACDGHIDKREVAFIKGLGEDENIFGSLNIQQELDIMIKEINISSSAFLKGYFKELKEFSLTEEEELSIISIAIKTIDADEMVEYSEIKFFKIIRSKLQISNKKILEVMPAIETYLEQDIMYKSNKETLQEDYFSEIDLPEFENIKFEG